MDKSGNSIGSASEIVKTPLDLLYYLMDEAVKIKCRGNRKLQGQLIAYDEHLNLVLKNVAETIYTNTVDASTGASSVQEDTRKFELLFLRGDSVITVSSADAQ